MPFDIEERDGKTLSVYKDDDGNRHMMIVTSNGYKDRENEFVSTEALQGYVNSQWGPDDKWQGDNTLLFWHDGPPIGDIIHADMEGPFLFEVARERKSGLPFITHYTKAIWDYVENNPDEQWGASHGFSTQPEDIELTSDGLVFRSIRKFETSIVPVEYAANAYTVSGVLEMAKERDTKLNEIAPGIADKLRGLLRLQTEELDKAGVEQKTLGPQVTMQDLIDVSALAIEIAVSKTTDDGEEQVTMKDALGLAFADLMEVPTVNLETAEAILAVEDEPEVDDDDAVDDAEHDHTEPEESELEKALAKTLGLNEQLINDQRAIIEILPGLVAQVKAVSNIAPNLEALTAQVADMQENFKQRPRASKSKATVVVEGDELAKDAIQEDEKLSFGYPTN